MIPEARPAVIVTGWRTGGTFLTHCLSNHPDIFCTRGEVLHKKGVWRKFASPVQTLAWVFGQHHYLVAMCKLTYTQAFRDAAVWRYLVKVKPRMLWLYRENVIRQGVSMFLMKLHSQKRIEQPVHSLRATKPARVRIDPEVVLHYARRIAEADRSARGRLDRFEVLALTYAEVVGGEGTSAASLPEAVTRRVCGFLGVPAPDHPLGCRLRAVNPFPLARTITNWAEVRKAVRASEFAELLGDER